MVIGSSPCDTYIILANIVIVKVPYILQGFFLTRNPKYGENHCGDRLWN
jgi:hypothetical protein